MLFNRKLLERISELEKKLRDKDVIIDSLESDNEYLKEKISKDEHEIGVHCIDCKYKVEYKAGPYSTYFCKLDIRNRCKDREEEVHD